MCDCLTLSRNVNPLRVLPSLPSELCVCVRVHACSVLVCMFEHHKNGSIKLEFELCLRIMPFGYSLLFGRHWLICELNGPWGRLNNLSTKRTFGCACVRVCISSNSSTSKRVLMSTKIVVTNKKKCPSTFPEHVQPE